MAEQWERWGDGLRPVSKAAKERLAKFRNGERISVEISDARSEAQSRLYWSVLRKVAAALDAINFRDQHWNKDLLHIALKMALGKYDVVSFNGKAVPVIQSMAKWNQEIQGPYFDEAMDMICAALLPKIGDADLTNEIVSMLAPKADAA